MAKKAKLNSDGNVIRKRDFVVTGKTAILK